MNKYILLLFVLVGFSSCFNDRIDLDLNEGQEKLVITAWLTDLDEPHFVSITKTTNFLGDEDLTYVTDAIVNVSNDTESYDLTYDELGRYLMPEDFQATVGDVYHLEVMHEGIAYKAEHKMRICPGLENLKTILDEELSKPDSLEQYSVAFSFQEIPGEGDAYFGVDYLKGRPLSKNLDAGGYTNDMFLDGEYLDDISIGSFLYVKGDTVVVDIYSIGEETANFLTDVAIEFYRGGPFDPPPANIRTNISGGAVGYFIVSGAQRKMIVVE